MKKPLNFDGIIYMWQEFQVFLLSMTPIGELRAAIPVGLIAYKLNWLEVYIISVMGNLVPVVFLLLFLKPASDLLAKKFPFMEKFFGWLFERTREKHKKVIDKHGWWGLATFVAIPLPITGSWTGTLLAFLTGMSFKKAFSAIALGVITAGVIVTTVIKAGLAIEDYFGWKYLVIAIFLFGSLWLIFNRKKLKRNKH